MKFKSGTRRRALEYEKAIAEWWKENKTFEKSVERRDPANSYVFYDGPPFITGVPHHGTLLSSIVKDAVPRYFTMKGKRVERRWGWDCHGLPAENFVEKQLGIVDRRQIVTDPAAEPPKDKDGQELPTITLEKYITAARESMVANSETWESVIDRIGRWVDFRGAYRTMDADFMESVWWAFKKLYEAGKIYEGEKVLMYDTKFATPVSKAEVTMDNDAYQTVTDPSVFVKFKLTPESIGDKTAKLGLPVYFLAWTTTPWTLPGNTALAVNPNMNYSEIRVGDEIFILAKDLIDKVLVDEKKKPFEYEIIHNVLPGEKLVGKSYEPLFANNNNVIASEVKQSSKKKQIIAVDIDDVLCNFVPEFLHFSNHHFGTNLAVDDYVEFWEDLWKVDSDEVLRRKMELFNSDFYLNLTPVEGVREILEKLKENFQLVAATSRPEHLLDKTKTWLSKNYPNIFSEIHHLGLYFINGNKQAKTDEEIKKMRVVTKADFCENLGADFLIDDQIKHVADLEKCGTRGILFGDYPWNRGLTNNENVVRARNWKEVEKYFDEIVSQNNNWISDQVQNDNAHKIWPADYVSSESGTGIVHIAPAYGEEDFELAKKNNIPVQHALDDNGYYFPEIAADLYKLMPWRNADEPLEVWEANKDIAKGLKTAGKVWKIEYIQHEYPFNPRSKQRIMYRAIPSWFFDIQGSKPLMLEQNENINWFPPHLKHGRFAKNIEQAPDWNLSRDRFWATAMPVWKGDRGTVKVVGSYAELEELSGKRLEDYHRPWVDEITFEIDGEKFERIDKVLDCWFESGSMPFAQFHYPFENQEKFEANYPGDFIVEYIGQVRAWFYYVHAVNAALAECGAFGEYQSRSKLDPETSQSEKAESHGFRNKSGMTTQELNAFKNVITTGTLAGNDGRKMSKSLGNFTDPNELMDEYSADSLRFLLMSSPVLSGEDFALKDKDVSDVARKLAMIWNMYDFFTMYAEVDGWEFVDNVKIDYFVHGTTHDNEKEIATGWNPGELSPLGIQQCKEMSEHLKGRKFDAIFCSDLDRAVESAKIFFPGAEIIPDERLRECNYGDLNSKSASEVRDEEHVDVPFPNGESMRDVEKRVRDFCEFLGEKYAGKNVAVLAHRAPQLALQVICDGLSWPEAFEKDWRKTKNYQPGWEYNYQISAPQISLDDLQNPLDKWIVSRVHELTAHITKFMDEYNLPDAMSAILPFVDDASNWFVRRSRRRFWKSDDDADKNDAYRTLHYVLVKQAMMMAPFTPFLAEELYQKLTGGESVHLLGWPTEVSVDEKVLEDMARTREIINAGLAKRMSDDEFGKIKIRQPLHFMDYYGKELSGFYEQIIADEVNVKAVMNEPNIEYLRVDYANNAEMLAKIDNDKDGAFIGTCVSLDKKIDAELKREGLSREVVRAVQSARKNAGLNVDDRITLELKTDDEILQKAIDEWRETIAAETLATEFAANDGFETTVEIEKTKLKISLSKADES